MDIESLKVVLATVQSVSGDAKEVAVWWFALQVLQTFLWFCFGVVGLVSFYRVMDRTLGQDMERLRDAMGVGMPGRVNADEFVEMLDWIKERR